MRVAPISFLKRVPRGRYGGHIGRVAIKMFDCRSHICSQV